MSRSKCFVLCCEDLEEIPVYSNAAWRAGNYDDTIGTIYVKRGEEVQDLPGFLQIHDGDEKKEYRLKHRGSSDSSIASKASIRQRIHNKIMTDKCRPESVNRSLSLETNVAAATATDVELHVEAVVAVKETTTVTEIVVNNEKLSRSSSSYKHDIKLSTSSGSSSGKMVIAQFAGKSRSKSRSRSPIISRSKSQESVRPVVIFPSVLPHKSPSRSRSLSAKSSRSATPKMASFDTSIARTSSISYSPSPKSPTSYSPYTKSSTLSSKSPRWCCENDAKQMSRSLSSDVSTRDSFEGLAAVAVVTTVAAITEGVKQELESNACSSSSSHRRSKTYSCTTESSDKFAHRAFKSGSGSSVSSSTNAYAVNRAEDDSSTCSASKRHRKKVITTTVTTTTTTTKKCEGTSSESGLCIDATPLVLVKNNSMSSSLSRASTSSVVRDQSMSTAPSFSIVASENQKERGMSPDTFKDQMKYFNGIPDNQVDQMIGKCEVFGKCLNELRKSESGSKSISYLLRGGDYFGFAINFVRKEDRITANLQWSVRATRRMKGHVYLIHLHSDRSINPDRFVIIDGRLLKITTNMYFPLATYKDWKKVEFRATIVKISDHDGYNLKLQT